EIHCLWVSERLRDQGIGSRLVLAIEQEAAERGGSTAITNTYSFQAPEFYAKLGYETFGIIPGFGNRFQKYFLRKNL
ncbi:MAG TPA: GNAT family N-acetyltransferase, partial [candidate division Zixibacteria bacterium]|nr:GNAT family N-acetyltransferase [candidate division Zixibacteria bacterium]